MAGQGSIQGEIFRASGLQSTVCNIMVCKVPVLYKIHILENAKTILIAYLHALRSELVLSIKSSKEFRHVYISQAFLKGIFCIKYYNMISISYDFV